MARYRKIDPRVWNDRKFRGMSDDAKLVFLFILTHPSMTALGAMRATMAGLASELGWETKDFGEAFREASSKGMLEADEEASFVGAPNFVKYNAPESPNVITAWRECLSLIPECDRLDTLLARVKAVIDGKAEAFRKAFAEAFPQAIAHPSNQEQEPEQEQEQENKDNATAAQTRPGRNKSATAADGDNPGFTTFWDAYPAHDRKQDKPKCLKLWQSRKLEPRAAEIVTALAKWRSSKAWTKNGGEFICSPHRWLNESRYDTPPADGAHQPHATGKSAAAGDDDFAFIKGEIPAAPITPELRELIRQPPQPGEPGHRDTPQVFPFKKTQPVTA